MQPPGDLRQIHRLAVGPDAGDGRHLPLAQPDGEVGEVAVGGGGRGDATAALAALCGGRGLALLDQAGGPDHLPGQPHGAVDARDHGALGGAHHLQVVQPRPLDMLLRAAEDHAVHGRPGQRSDGPPGDHPDRPEPHRRPGPRPGRRQNQRRHASPLNEKGPEIRPFAYFLPTFMLKNHAIFVMQPCVINLPCAIVHMYH